MVRATDSHVGRNLILRFMRQPNETPQVLLSTLLGYYGKAGIHE